MGNGCCHIPINSLFGNETKSLNPVLLYNANVSPSNVPKYANDHLQYKISGSCKHLAKMQSNFSQGKYLCTQTTPYPGLLFSHSFPDPLLCALGSPEVSSPRYGAPKVPRAWQGSQPRPHPQDTTLQCTAAALSGQRKHAGQEGT